MRVLSRQAITTLRVPGANIPCGRDRTLYLPDRIYFIRISSLYGLWRGIIFFREPDVVNPRIFGAPSLLNTIDTTRPPVFDCRLKTSTDVILFNWSQAPLVAGRDCRYKDGTVIRAINVEVDLTMTCGRLSRPAVPDS